MTTRSTRKARNEGRRIKSGAAPTRRKTGQNSTNCRRRELDAKRWDRSAATMFCEGADDGSAVEANVGKKGYRCPNIIAVGCAKIFDQNRDRSS